jgi:hypothetical protein
VVAAVAALANVCSGEADTETAKVGCEGFDGFVSDGHPKTEIEVRRHPSGLVVLQRAGVRNYPQPTGFRTVVAGYGEDQVRYTAMRHNVAGTNHLGQDSTEFPFCLLNLPAWRRSPFDLRLTRWYRSEQEAIDQYRPKPPAPPAPEPKACAADFGGGVRIEIVKDGSRWLMWEMRGGRARRRTDFASPFLDHARRTAVHWYGEPLSEWQEQEDATHAAQSRRTRRRR